MGGFTLIEFVCTIVILGILTGGIATRFVDVGDSAHAAVVEAVTTALITGHSQMVFNWQLAGAPGKGSTSPVDLPFDGITVRYRNGHPNTTTKSSHIPVGTPDRNTAPARLFFLFLNPVPQPIIENTSQDTGWVMLGTNANCASTVNVGPNPKRCWEYRVGGDRFARISYSSSSGEFYVD